MSRCKKKRRSVRRDSFLKGACRLSAGGYVSESQRRSHRETSGCRHDSIAGRRLACRTRTGASRTLGGDEVASGPDLEAARRTLADDVWATPE